MSGAGQGYRGAPFVGEGPPIKGASQNDGEGGSGVPRNPFVRGWLRHRDKAPRIVGGHPADPIGIHLGERMHPLAKLANQEVLYFIAEKFPPNVSPGFEFVDLNKTLERLIGYPPPTNQDIKSPWRASIPTATSNLQVRSQGDQCPGPGDSASSSSPC